MDDEELVLRAVMPQDQVDAMKAAGPARRNYSPAAKPIITLLEALSRERDLSHFALQKPGFRLLLTR
jgi:oxaloacetate decarboxylase alpha subunit